MSTRAGNPSAMRVGEVHFANSGNPAAQAPFLRGLALLHDFEYSTAAEAFREAQAADPGFVMAYWGEAMTHNHPLWAEQDAEAARAVLARLGPTPRRARPRRAAARERQWLVGGRGALWRGHQDRARPRLRRPDAGDASKPIPTMSTPARFDALSVMGLAHTGRDIGLYMQAAALLEEAFPSQPRSSRRRPLHDPCL